MKLNLDSSLLQTPVSGASGPALRPLQAGRAAESGPGGDSVRMSGVAGILHRSDTERASRISALARAFQEGTYKVSASDLGKAIISHAGG